MTALEFPEGFFPANRLSISWSRVRSGGLDHYEHLVDELLAHGTTPVLTLHHRDLPPELADSGGWAERDTAARFAEYAELVGARLGDRVPIWTTLNEPWCSAFLGNASGEQALAAAHHLLLAHGLGTQALRGVLPSSAQVSITLNLSSVLPAVTSTAATNAVRRIDGLANRLFLDPLFRGHYPTDVLRDTARLTDWSFVRPADLAVISAPIDLLGINYRTPTLVDVGMPVDEPSPWPACRDVRFVEAPTPATAMGWAIHAQGLRNVVHRLHDQYQPIPLLIAEDGALLDETSAREHLTIMREAITHGVELRGYFVWNRQVISTNGIKQV